MIFFSIVFIFGDIIPIKEIKINDANGEPIHKGETVTITGRITCGTEFGSRGPAAIQDTSGAVSIYDDAVGNLKIGDSIVITGIVDFYNGLTEIGDVSSVDKIKEECFEIPIIITVSQMEEIVDNIEVNESKLVKIENVTIKESGTFEGNTAYTIEDASGEGKLYIDRDTDIPGNEIPQGSINIVGIVAQWDNQAPYLEGYELKPRRWLDFDTVPPEMETEQLPDQTEPGPYTVNVTIIDELNIILDTLYYDIGNGLEGTTHYEKAGDVYKFRIPTPSQPGSVQYYVVAYDENLNKSRDPENEGEYYSFNVNVGIEEKPSKGFVFLDKNGVINVSLREASYIKIAVYDITGNKVISVFSGFKETGSYKFHLPKKHLCFGVYFVKVNIKNTQKILKFINVR